MRLLAGAGAVLLGAGALVVAGVGPGAATRPSGPSQADYAEAIEGPARDGGFVVEQGLKVGLRRVAAGEADGVMLQAVQWVNQLKAVQARFADAARGSRDPDVRAAAALFDDALTLYRQAAETIGAAAIATGEPRQKLLEQAAETGRKADAEYDRAMARLRKGEG